MATDLHGDVFVLSRTAVTKRVGKLVRQLYASLALDEGASLMKRKERCSKKIRRNVYVTNRKPTKIYLREGET